MTTIANALFILSIFSGIICLLWWTFFDFDNPLAPDDNVTDFFHLPLVARAVTIASLYTLSMLIPFTLASIWSNTAAELVVMAASAAFVVFTLETRDDLELV